MIPLAEMAQPTEASPPIHAAPAAVSPSEMENVSEELEQGYRLSHRIYEVSGMGATVVTGGWLAARVFHNPSLRAWWIPIAMALGMMGADLVSGVVHWLFDTWGSVDTPVVGKLAIRTFRQHHIDPHAMLRHDFVETNGHNFALALTLTLGGLCVVPAANASDGVLFVGLAMFMMAVFVALTSQIHKWAHTASPPRVVVRLQRAGLLLSPEHHQHHHNAPHENNYCITVGWLDGFLTRTRSFERIEQLIEWLTGIEPRRHP